MPMVPDGKTFDMFTIFSHCDTIHECDKLRDGQTYRQTYRYTQHGHSVHCTCMQCVTCIFAAFQLIYGTMLKILENTISADVFELKNCSRSFVVTYALSL